MRLIGGVGEMRQRRRIALRPRERGDAERRQRFLRHHPRRHRGGEILAEERTERLIFPTLHVARRPVVQQAEAENVLGRLADRDGVAELGRHADIEAELELEIEIARRTVGRHRFFGALALALRPLHRRAADAHRRGAAVIGDRHVFVVRQQRIVRPKRAAGIGGVKDRGVEIGEVADRDRQDAVRPAPSASNAGRKLLSPRSALKLRDNASRSADHACGPSDISSLRCGAGAGFRRLGGRPAEGRGGRGDVEDLIADRDADARRLCPRPGEIRRTADSESENRCPARWRCRQNFAAPDRAFR